mgnify:CR=1 FL=1
MELLKVIMDTQCRSRDANKFLCMAMRGTRKTLQRKLHVELPFNKVSYRLLVGKENDNGFNNDALTAALMLLANMGVVTIRIYLPMFPSCWLRFFFSSFLGGSSSDTAKDNFCVVESSNV